MTPGEPPAQLDDPLADLVVDVPQVRGESSSSTAASRTLPVGSAGRPTGLMRSRAAAVPRPGQSGPGRHAERPSGRAVVVGHRFPLGSDHGPSGETQAPTSMRSVDLRLDMQAVADWCWARCGLDCVGGLTGDASPAASGG
jgi:hypothetical protein